MPKPQLSDPLTLRLPLAVLRDVEAIAEGCERTRSWVIVRALKTYLASEGRDVLAAINGRAEIAAGQSSDMTDVLSEIDAIARGSAA